MHLDNRLSFNDHIDYLIKRASRQLNCLIRFSRTLEVEVKLLLYKTFILSNFNFCPVVWHQCGRVNTDKLERLQFRALRFVYRDFTSDYHTLLGVANLPTLEVARLQSIATETFKAVNGLSPQYISQMFTPSSHSYNLRAENTLAQTHKSTTKGGLQSFQHLGVQIWNSLPNHLRTITEYNVFKSLIKTWFGKSCKCVSCGATRS